MNEDPVAASLTSWVRHHTQQLTPAELVGLGTGDMPMSMAVHQALDIPEYRDAYHALERDPVIAPFLTTPGGDAPILYAPWTRLFLWANQLPMGILAAAALEAALEDIPLSAEIMEDRCLQHLAATRAICQGQRYVATVASAISGVTLPADLELRLPWGALLR
jgi:hypothetical protein